MNKKKLYTLISIACIVIGLAVFLFPIIIQTKNDADNDERIEGINAIIKANQEAMLENQEQEEEQQEAQAEPVPETEGESASDTSESFVITAPIIDELPADTDDSDGETGSLILGEGDTEGLLLDSETGEEIDPATVASRLSGQDCIGVINIDKIDVCYAIVEGVEYANIGVSIGHFEDSVGIGKDGNCALAGHNGGVYGRYFGDIKDLRKGDEIRLTDLLGQEYTYVVTESFKVEPTQVEVVGELEEKGKFLTLVTCCENGTRRLIVRAKCTKPPVLIKEIR